MERSPSGSAYIKATHTIHGGDCLIRVSDHASRPSNRPKPQVDINPKKDGARELTEFLDNYRKVRREKKKRRPKKWCSRPHPDDVDDI